MPFECQSPVTKHHRRLWNWPLPHRRSCLEKYTKRGSSSFYPRRGTAGSLSHQINCFSRNLGTFSWRKLHSLLFLSFIFILKLLSFLLILTTVNNNILTTVILTNRSTEAHVHLYALKVLLHLWMNIIHFWIRDLSIGH